MEDKKLKQLIYYAQYDKPILPLTWMIGERCSCGQNDCKSPGKHPLVVGGLYSATVVIETIKHWHAKWPNANWGMRTGDVSQGGSGVLAVDIDPRNGGYQTWEHLQYENPEPIETVTVATGGGGQHFWFYHPYGVVIESGNNLLGPGVDIKANPGYVLIPPSRTQQSYRFEINPDEVEIAQIPDWMYHMLNGRDKGDKEIVPAIERAGEVVVQGARHDTLVETAGSMRRIGMKQVEIENALLAIRDQRFMDGDHAVTASEVREIVDWVCSKPREYMHTDLGNAERFIEMHRDNVRYCKKWESWLVWDGSRWAVDDTSELQRKAYSTVRGIYAEAASQGDDTKRKAIASHAIKSESRSRIENLLQLAKALVPVQPDDFDQNPMLLNVANGTIDLSNGGLLPHNREDMITKLMDVHYNQGAKCPEWEKFLDLVTGGDKELQLFLQLGVGYSLTGLTDEHCLFFLYGTGQNGKTTFTETIRRLLGDYSHRTDIEALMQSWSRGQGPSPYIAGMAGARFIVASEIAENRKMNESLIKDLTGGDSLTARFLFGNPFTFEPTHKLWVFGNYKPRISGMDLGLWRRMRVIPFSTTIPEETRRPLSEVMDMFSAEMSGILTWAVTGCLMWQKIGLEIVEAVKDATAEYHTEQDLVQQFLDEKCEMHSEYSILKSELYAAWRDWCEDAGEIGARKRSKRWLTRQMTDRGFEHAGAGRRELSGVKLA
jgi:putative DNA primase/helicase